MIPQRKGVASRQAHVDLPEGTVEEEHGRQAFTAASHLYRTRPMAAWVKVEGPLRPRRSTGTGSPRPTRPTPRATRWSCCPTRT